MKKIIFIILAFLTILLGCSAENLIQNGDMFNPSTGSSVNPSVPGDPEVVFDYIPPLPTGTYVYGHVVNVNPAQYKMCLWIYVPSWGWVPKKTYVEWVTPIQANSNWYTTFWSGGHDEDATYMIHYVIPISYPSYADINTLAIDSLTYTMVNRYDIATGVHPQIFVTNPAAAYAVISNVLGSTNLTIMGRASDNYELRGVYLALNDLNFKVIRPNKNNLWNSTMGWQTNLTLNKGTNIFLAFSKDCGDQNSVTQQVVIFCQGDITPPSVQFTTPNGFTTPDASITVTGTAADNTELEGVYVFVNGRFYGKAAGKESWSFTADLTGAVNTVSAYSKDTAGNMSETATITINRTAGGGSGGGSGGGVGGVSR